MAAGNSGDQTVEFRISEAQVPPHTHSARSSAHGGPRAPLCLEAQHSFKTH